MLSKRNLLFVLSLSLLAGAIKAVVVNPVGKVKKIKGKGLKYQDDNGTTCEQVGRGNSVWTCFDKNSKVIVGGSYTGSGGYTGDGFDAWQSFLNFQNACKCD